MKKNMVNIDKIKCETHEEVMRDTTNESIPDL